jgi:parallel beta-helix repeat protein
MNKLLTPAVFIIMSLGLTCMAEEYNSEYIQKRIDALPAVGGQVQLPEGKFKIDKTITVRSGVKVRGRGKKTILVADKILKGPLLTNNDWQKGSDNIRLSSMYFNGNADKMKLSKNNYHKRAYAENASAVDNVGVYLKKTSNAILTGLKFENFRNEAIVLINCRRIIVSRNVFSDCSRKGRYDDWAQGSVYLRYSSGCIIADNKISNCFEGGIVIGFRSNNNMIIDNYIHNSASGEGVFIGCGSGNTVSGNKILKTSTKGLGTGAGIAISVPPSQDKKLFPAINNFIFKNTVEQTGGSGISVYRADSNSIMNNIVRQVNMNKNAGRGGISIYESNNMLIVENTIESKNAKAINIYKSNNLLISGNNEQKNEKD